MDTEKKLTSTITQEMSTDFKVFKTAVARQFERMSKHPLFYVEIDKRVLWETYLASFPEGTNPIHKERTEYDCQCCKSFVRVLGNVVADINGQMESIWDINTDYPYETVADHMAELVHAAPIANIFLHTEATAGTDRNFQQILDQVRTWEHFFVNLPKANVVRKVEIGPKLSDARATHDVLLRSLTEINNDAIDTVLDLMAQGSLYRGEEHKFAVTNFQKVKRKFTECDEERRRDIFVWTQAGKLPQSVSRIRNTVIGTLLTDLSEGANIEDAVGSYEAKVAPSNYKRPVALVSKRMIEQARSKIQELGLLSALDRRYATLADVTVNNSLFVDRAAGIRNIMGGVFEEISAQIPDKPKNFDKVEEVTIERFIEEIVPRVESLEVMFESAHTGNLVSLIAPVDPTAGRLFKWDNPFSWAYNGDFTDSVKERVKKAGGSVAGDLCCRLAWYNRDDLDLHMLEPSGYRIYYSNKRKVSPCGGMLDVDMNVSGETREPVENIYYTTKQHMAEGIYSLCVNNFTHRESIDVGFEIEIDFLGTVYRFSYDKVVREKETIEVAKFKYSHRGGIEFINSLPPSQNTKTIWGISTQRFHPVQIMLLSPNHWDGRGVGNKHYLFMLKGCQNDGQARGFFNEFLRGDLDPHRKAFELVGAKVRTNESNNQLSGLGFSSTQRNSILCRVKGSFTRVLRVAI